MEADWEVNLTICDLVRGQEVTAKDAIASLKKKLTPDNPHVMMLGLSVLEALMKNCGTPIHDEVLGTSFVLSLLDFISVNVEIRNRILGFIQNWEFAFKKNDQYSYLHEAYEEVLNSGYELPPFHESEAMFAAEVAPNWKDGDECFRCKATFTTFRRKHHCRNCGNVFCGECTTGRAGIPKYGIEKEVRVCELCLRELTAPANDRSASANRKKEAKRVNFRGFLEKLNGNPSNNTSQHEHNQQHQQRLQHQKEHEAKMKELRLREEEELQLALALSASEAESKQMKQRQAASSSQPSSSSQPQQQQQSKPTTSGGGSVLPGSDAGGSEFPTEVDPELARYLNRNYWLGKAASIAESTDSYVSGFSPSAPVFPPPVNPDYEPSVADPSVNTSYLRIGIQNEKLGDTLKGLGLTSAGVEMPLEGSSLPGVPPLTSPKTEEFLSALKKSLDVFCNRMRVCSQRGRLLTSDNTLQALFKTLHQMNLQLMEYSNDLESRRTSLEKLQDQTTQIRDARDALDALRKEYAEQRRREEEEAHRLRQIQMMQKVEVLRQQKRTALEAQSRQLMEQSMAYQQQQYGAYAYGYPGMPPPQPQQPMMPYGAPPPMGYTPDYYATPYEANAMMQVQHPVPAPVEPMPRPSGSEVDLQHPTTTNGTSDQAQQQQQQQQQQPVERKQQQQEEPFDLHPMMQSLPPPSHPQLEFAQPAPNPATAAAVNASIDQMPAPPTDDLPNVASAKTATEKPPDESATRVEDAPSPQLICLE